MTTAPTHGLTKVIPITDIEVSTIRQRSDAIDTTDLQNSLTEFGQLQPIVLTTSGKLLAGWRRYTAAIALGWTEIQVKYIEATGVEEDLVEYTENSARKNLTWQEECVAVATINQTLEGMYPEWNVGQTAETLCISRSHAAAMLSVAGYYLANQTKCQSMKLQDVLVKVRQKANREKADILDDIENTFLPTEPPREQEEFAAAIEEIPLSTLFADTESEDEPPLPLTIPAPKATPTKPKPVAETAVPELFNYHFGNTDCYDFAKSWKGKPFNFLHLDPPYGMGVNNSDNQQSKKSSVEGSYSDSLQDFQDAIDFWIASPPAHVVNLNYCTAVVWHNPKTWPKLKAAAIAGGWEYMDFPFVAHKTNNSGVIPNPSKDFRRTYETAMFLYRNTSVVENVAASIGVSFASKELHTTEKPVAALQHVFRGLLFQRARVLDPYAGSGSALVALMQMYTQVELVVGLEKEKVFFDAAEIELRKRYGLLKASHASAKSRLAEPKDKAPKAETPSELPSAGITL